ARSVDSATGSLPIATSAHFASIALCSGLPQLAIHCSIALPMGRRKTIAVPSVSVMNPITRAAKTCSLIGSLLLVQPAASVSGLQHLAQELPGMRRLGLHDLLRRSFGYHVAAQFSALGPQVDDPVGCLHDVP